MIIFSFQVGYMQTNAYLIQNKEEALLIDPGDDASFLLEKIQEKKLKLVGIIATHGHFDHVLATGEIQLCFPLPLLIHQRDEFLLKQMLRSATYYLPSDPYALPPQTLSYIKNNMLNISSFKLRVLFTPGHTPGSLCLYIPKEKVLLSGDTLFNAGVGRYDYAYSSKEDLKRSLISLFKLPPTTRVLPGHGQETTLKAESVYVNYYTSL